MADVADPPKTDAAGFNLAENSFQGSSGKVDFPSDFDADVFGDGLYDFDIWSSSQTSFTKPATDDVSKSIETSAAKPASSRRGRSTTSKKTTGSGDENFDLSFHFEEFGGNSFTTATETTVSTGHSSLGISVQSATTSATKATTATSDSNGAKSLSAVDPVKKKFAEPAPRSRSQSRSRKASRHKTKVTPAPEEDTPQAASTETAPLGASVGELSAESNDVEEDPQTKAKKVAVRAMTRGASRRNMMKHMRSNSMVLRQQGSLVGGATPPPPVSSENRPRSRKSLTSDPSTDQSAEGGEVGDWVREPPRRSASGRTAPRTRGAPENRSVGRSASSTQRRVSGRRADPTAAVGPPKQLGVLGVMSQEAQRRHRPTRGVARSKSSDNDSLVRGPSRGVQRSKSNEDENLAPRPPTRGVRRAKSSDNDNLLARPPMRSIPRTKSNEGNSDQPNRRPRARRPSLKILERLESDIQEDIMDPPKPEGGQPSRTPPNGPPNRRGQMMRSSSMVLNRRGNNNAAVAAAANSAAAGGAKALPTRGRGLVRSNSMKMVMGGAAKANKLTLQNMTETKPSSKSPPRSGLARSNSTGNLRDEEDQPQKDQAAPSVAPSRPVNRRAMMARSHSMKLGAARTPAPPPPEKMEEPVAMNPVQRRMMRRSSMQGAGVSMVQSDDVPTTTEAATVTPTSSSDLTPVEA